MGCQISNFFCLEYANNEEVTSIFIDEDITNYIANVSDGTVLMIEVTSDSYILLIIKHEGYIGSDGGKDRIHNISILLEG